MSDRIVGQWIQPGGNKTPASLTTITCSLQDCPLLAAGRCLHVDFTRGRFHNGLPCPYGTTTVERGATARSRKYHGQLDTWRKTVAANGGQKATGWYEHESLVVIGEWVALPYPHMRLVERIPWKAQGDYFSAGEKWIRLADFTPEVIVRLATEQVYAMLGGYIKGYREDVVAKFLYDLKHNLLDLYHQAYRLDARVMSLTAGPAYFADTPLRVKMLPTGTAVKKIDHQVLKGTVHREPSVGWVASIESDVKALGLWDLREAADPDRKVAAIIPLRAGALVVPSDPEVVEALWKQGKYTNTWRDA